MSIGAHIHSDDPLGAARERDADVVQFFLGDPQSWKKQPPHPQADALREAGIEVVDRVPLLGELNSHNARYVQTKHEHAGHLRADESHG